MTEYRAALLAHHSASIAENAAYQEYLQALQRYNLAKERTAKALAELQKERARMETEMMAGEEFR